MPNTQYLFEWERMASRRPLSVIFALITEDRRIRGHSFQIPNSGFLCAYKGLCQVYNVLQIRSLRFSPSFLVSVCCDRHRLWWENAQALPGREPLRVVFPEIGSSFSGSFYVVISNPHSTILRKFSLAFATWVSHSSEASRALTRPCEQQFSRTSDLTLLLRSGFFCVFRTSKAKVPGLTFPKTWRPLPLILLRILTSLTEFLSLKHTGLLVINFGCGASFHRC